MIDRLRYSTARRSICALGRLTVPDYAASWHHKVKGRYIEQAIQYARFRGTKGGISRLLISEPPQHGKSLHASALAPALALGQDPNLTVMATAYGSRLAGRAVEETRGIMNHPSYREAFPTRLGRQIDSQGKTHAVKDQAYYFRVMRENSDGSIDPTKGSFYSGGVTAGLTGHGFRLGVMDDWVKDEQDAISYSSQLKRIGQYTKAFNTRKQGGASIIAIGTMWDNPDWLDWLWELWTSQGHDPVWLRFPSLTDEYAGDLHFEDPRAPLSLEPLWPTRFSLEEVLGERKGLLTADKGAWCALYQQNPIKISGQLFPKGAWQKFQVTGEHAFDLQRFDSLHLSVDGNVKETGSSFAVIAAYGVLIRAVDGETVKNYFRLDESRGHYEFAELRDETLRMWQKWTKVTKRTGFCWVEDKANGPALMSQLNGHGIPFRAVPKSRSKLMCYRMAQLAVMENRVWLPADSNEHVTDHWVSGFVSELASQPSSPDDRADEISQMIICNDPQLGIELLGLR
jgi:hypothetical protein